MNKQHLLSLLNQKEMNLRVASILGNSDDLSAVLIIHLACEKIIETWIEAATNKPDFFSNVSSITFYSKLQIAKNLSLPDTPFDFMKTLNKIRNKFAHQITKNKVSDDEINELYNSLSHYLESQPENDPKRLHCISYGKEYTFNDGNNVKLSMMFSCVFLSIYHGAGLMG